MQHPDEGMIHTWLDGELPAEEAAALEAHVADCGECKALVAEARGFIAASSRIIGTLDNVPSGVIPAAKPVKRVWYSSPQFRAAAAVLVVAGASLLVMRSGTQKATLSDSVRPEAGEVATMQRAMSAPAPAVANSAVVRPPVVADQVAAKVESARPAEPANPKSASASIAPVPQPVALNKIAANEEEFSGKGVKGGTSTGVAGGVPIRDTAALSGRVAGVAMKAADAATPRMPFAQASTDLKALRVDSTVFGKRTTYQTSSGRQVVLVEQPEQAVLSEVVVTGVAESRERAKQSSSAPTRQSAPAPAPAPSPPAAVQDELATHTISWVDSATHRRYTLTGPVSVEELQSIKARLLQLKR